MSKAKKVDRHREFVEIFPGRGYYTGMSRQKKALTFFQKGYNCTQSLLAVYGHGRGMKQETAFRIAGAFGGGMGKTGDVCGAVTGGLMIVGLEFGTPDLEDETAIHKTYDQARRFIREFKQRNNTVVCRELLRCDSDVRQRTSMNDVYSNCPKFVKDAAEIIEEILG